MREWDLGADFDERMTESAWRRARRDFIAAAHTVRFWIGAAIILPLGGAVGALLSPSAWDPAGTTFLVAGASIVSAGALALAVLAGALVLAPFRQRNEARTWVYSFDQPLNLDVGAAVVEFQKDNGYGWIVQLIGIRITNRSEEGVSLGGQLYVGFKADVENPPSLLESRGIPGRQLLEFPLNIDSQKSVAGDMAFFFRLAEGIGDLAEVVSWGQLELFLKDHVSQRKLSFHPQMGFPYRC